MYKRQNNTKIRDNNLLKFSWAQLFFFLIFNVLYIFLVLPPLLPSLLLHSLMSPMVHVYSEGVVILLFRSMQVSFCCLCSLGLWIVGWFSFSLCLKATYYIHLSVSVLHHSIWFCLERSICLPISTWT